MASGLGGVRASALVSRVREAANMEASQSGSSQFVTDAEIKQRVDEAASGLYDTLVTSLGEDYFVRSVYADFNASSDVLGEPFVRLPTDFYRLITVHEVTNLEAVTAGEQPILRDVEPFQRADSTHLLNAKPQAHGPFFYRLSANRDRDTEDVGHTAVTRLVDRLEIWPRPSVDQQFRVSFVPWFATFDAAAEGVTDGSEQAFTEDDPIYPGINGWEEYVVLKVAIRLLAKEQSDTSELRSDLAVVEQRIQSLRHRRDEGRVERVVLTRKRRKQGWYP